MAEKCAADPNCDLPQKIEDLDKKFDNKFSSLNKKIDKIDSCLTKVSQTLHGEEDFNFNGLIKENKRNKEEIKEIKSLLGWNRFIVDFWGSVKKPLYYAVLIVALSFIGAVISIKLGIHM